MDLGWPGSPPTPGGRPGHQRALPQTQTPSPLCPTGTALVFRRSPRPFGGGVTWQGPPPTGRPSCSAGDRPPLLTTASQAGSARTLCCPEAWGQRFRGEVVLEGDLGERPHLVASEAEGRPASLHPPGTSWAGLGWAGQEGPVRGNKHSWSRRRPPGGRLACEMTFLRTQQGVPLSSRRGREKPSQREEKTAPPPERHVAVTRTPVRAL